MPNYSNFFLYKDFETVIHLKIKNGARNSYTSRLVSLRKSAFIENKQNKFRVL